MFDKEFNDIFEIMLEKYQNNTNVSNRNLFEATDRIVCALTDLKEAIDYADSFELNEAKVKKSNKVARKIAPLIWRTLRNAYGAGTLRVGFEPRTFDSNKKGAGTVDGGGTVLAGPDSVKLYFKRKRDAVRKVDKRRIEGAFKDGKVHKRSEVAGDD